MSRSHKKSKVGASYRKYFWIIGIVIVSLLLIVFKNIFNRSVESANFLLDESPSLAPDQANHKTVVEESPEVKIDRFIIAKEPVFAFFHSNNCQLCLEMIDVVKEVFPEYVDEVHLVDINVYDEQNRNLLNRANIHSIPTQIFFNGEGEGFQSIGLMSVDQLRDAFDKIAGNK